jgi:biotin synthase
MALDIIKRLKKEFPFSIIMLAGGREIVFGKEWLKAIKAGANSIVIGDYLTTKGERADRDLELLNKAGFEVADEC